MIVEPKPIEQWDGLRVLTVREPWATLIVSGQKDCENRSRYFGHRGPLLIHASSTLTRPYYDAAYAWVSRYVAQWHRISVVFPTFEECKANCGKIIGGCEVGSCCRASESFWFDDVGFAIELGLAWKAPGLVAFRGQLGLGTFRKSATP